MANSNDNEFTYFIKLLDDQKEKYFLKSTIDEQNHTILIHLTNLKQSWVGVSKSFDIKLPSDLIFFQWDIVVNREQVRLLAKKFPSESADSFYSHTQRAFSKGNKADADGKSYVFNCKKLDKNRVEVRVQNANVAVWFISFPSCSFA